MPRPEPTGSATVSASLRPRATLAPPIHMEKFVIEGGCRCPAPSSPRATRTARCRAGCLPAHRRRGGAAQRPADQGRRGDGSAARGPGRARPVARPGRDVDRLLERRPTRGRPRARRADPRLVPARRAAAGPLRPRGDAAAGRRRDRPPPARPAPRRVPRARRRASSSTRDNIELRAPTGLQPCDFFMDEPSVMATENALMAAALTRGSTVIHNAASEPHVQDLARMLVAMGAPIDGHRLERDDRARRRSLARRRPHDRPRPHRDRLVHGAGRRAPAASCASGHGARGPAHDPAGVRAAGLRSRVRRQRRRRARQPAAA